MNRISGDRLLARLESLTQRECDTTLSILLHLNELEGRRLHLSMGYASMFDFATRHLRYSASAAGRRIQVARCLRRFPALVDPFRSREVNLSTVSLIARVIDQENARELLRRVRGRSQPEVEAIAAEYKAPVKVRDAARPIRVRVPTPPASSRRADSPELFDSRSRESRPSAMRSVGAAFKIQFAAGPELMTKLEEARTLLSGRSPKGVSFEEVFDAALDALLDRKSPARRQKRREARRSRKGGPATSSAVRSRIPAAVNASTPTAGVVVRNRARSRHVPAAVRDQVFVRDGGRCTYVGPTGNRCGTTHDLEIDHIVPIGRGGKATVDNLRLLCARHNLLAAERAYGSAFMGRFRRGVTSKAEDLARGRVAPIRGVTRR